MHTTCYTRKDDMLLLVNNSLKVNSSAVGRLRLGRDTRKLLAAHYTGYNQLHKYSTYPEELYLSDLNSSYPNSSQKGTKHLCGEQWKM